MVMDAPSDQPKVRMNEHIPIMIIMVVTHLCQKLCKIQKFGYWQALLFS